MEPYDHLGRGYDDSRKADPDLLRDLAFLLELDERRTFLDVGCGTGNYTAALERLGGRWVGVDPSSTMLQQARRKNAGIQWRQGRAENLEFEPQSFDGVLCSLCLHHFNSIGRAFKEIARVLKTGGRLVIFTATPRQMQQYWLWHYFPDMMRKSAAVMPSLTAIDQCLAGAGMQIVKIKPFFVTARLQDMFLYSGKQRPELYLSESFRRGISSFRQHITADELEQGLARLSGDIDSGGVVQVMHQYRADGGDYMTIQAER